MPNAFVHVELNTTDIAKAKKFYGQLFQWNLEDVDMGPAGMYTLIKPGEGTGGGMFQMPGIPTSMWLAYVSVDDVKAATQKAKSLGATIHKEVTEIPNIGWFSIIVDPTGAMLALWKPKAMK